MRCRVSFRRRRCGEDRARAPPLRRKTRLADPHDVLGLRTVCERTRVESVRDGSPCPRQRGGARLDRPNVGRAPFEAVAEFLRMHTLRDTPPPLRPTRGALQHTGSRKACSWDGVLRSLGHFHSSRIETRRGHGGSVGRGRSLYSLPQRARARAREGGGERERRVLYETRTAFCVYGKTRGPAASSIRGRRGQEGGCAALCRASAICCRPSSARCHDRPGRDGCHAGRPRARP